VPDENVPDDTVPDENVPASATRRRGRTAPFVALAIAVVCVALFLVLAGADSGDSESVDTPLMGRPAPEAIGELAGGQPFDLARRKGSWVVLNFFDSNCVPCVQEHPALVGFAESQEALGDQGAELITVVYGDDPDGVTRFFRDNGGGWPVVYDDDGSISAAFGVNLVPETWVVDPDGVIRWRTISTVSTEQLNQVVGSLRTLR
jgi:cytochrome c biogenesis protein CcmG/thiol:disulfide interchange protein DsbE